LLKAQETAALRNFDSAYDRFGSVATEAVGATPRHMSASLRKRLSGFETASRRTASKAELMHAEKEAAQGGAA